MRDGLRAGAAFLRPTAAQSPTRLPKRIRRATHEQVVTCACRHAHGRDHSGHHRPGAAGDPRRSDRREPSRARRTAALARDASRVCRTAASPWPRRRSSCRPTRRSCGHPVEEKIRAGFAERQQDARGLAGQARGAPRRRRPRATTAEGEKLALPERIEKRSQRLTERAAKMTERAAKAKEFAEVLKPLYASLRRSRRRSPAAC